MTDETKTRKSISVIIAAVCTNARVDFEQRLWQWSVSTSRASFKRHARYLSLSLLWLLARTSLSLRRQPARSTRGKGVRKGSFDWVYEKSVCPRTGKARRCAHPAFYVLPPRQTGTRDVLSRGEDCSGDKVPRFKKVSLGWICCLSRDFGSGRGFSWRFSNNSFSSTRKEYLWLFFFSFLSRILR